MVIRKAFKFRLDCTADQMARLRVLCGHARFVWNQALARCNTAYAAEGVYVPRYETMAKWITVWKQEPETEWLKDAYTDNLQQKLKDLDSAWRRYFDPKLAAERPRFKKKGRDRDSIRFVNFAKYCQLDGRRVKLPSGLGWCRFRKSRDITGTIKNCTLSLAAGHAWISFQTEQTVAAPVHPAPENWIGIDVGIARFATLSDGSYIAPLNSFKRHQQALAKAQRQLSRKVRFSSNWRKAKARIQRLQRRIANARQDFLHQTSTRLCQNHAMIVLEDLQVSNMSASAKGTSEAPGRRVRQKAGLNRSILDQGWGEFRRQLEYKAGWAGGEVLAVPAHHTSQTCPACGHVSGDNRKTQAAFACTDCGYKNNADVVGAVNILARGVKTRAKGGTSPGSPVMA
jgi:putative transposase